MEILAVDYTAQSLLKRSAVGQNKLLRARIVIKIRVVGSGSNKWRQTFAPVFLPPKRPALYARRAFARSFPLKVFPSERIANYWQWWKRALRIFPPPSSCRTRRRALRWRCPLKNRRGSLTGAGSLRRRFPRNAFFRAARVNSVITIINAYLFLSRE